MVAKGAGKIAERIKEIAGENQVPIIEDKPLAQALFKAVEVGQAIPGDLYEAVATILAPRVPYEEQGQGFYEKTA